MEMLLYEFDEAQIFGSISPNRMCNRLSERLNFMASLVETSS
jgi:hypothetical protein